MDNGVIENVENTVVGQIKGSGNNDGFLMGVIALGSGVVCTIGWNKVIKPLWRKGRAKLEERKKVEVEKPVENKSDNVPAKSKK